MPFHQMTIKMRESWSYWVSMRNISKQLKDLRRRASFFPYFYSPQHPNLKHHCFHFQKMLWWLLYSSTTSTKSKYQWGHLVVKVFCILILVFLPLLIDPDMWNVWLTFVLMYANSCHFGIAILNPWMYQQKACLPFS